MKSTSVISWDVFQGGPLAKLFFLWDEEMAFDVESCAEEVAKLDKLAQLWTPPSNSPDVNEIKVLEETLGFLRKTYIAMSIMGESIDTASACLSWPIRASDVYLEMVEKQSPEALVLLAHSTLLLNMCGNTWWLAGMSRRLLQEVHGALPEEWRYWIQWPPHDLVTSEFKYQIE